MNRHCVVSVVLAAVFTCGAEAQTLSDPNPRLGMQPTGVYSIDKIETINQVNGNLMLNIPLGSLGPNPVGATPGIGLIYNSKVWEAPSSSSSDGAAKGVLGAWHYQLGYDLEPSLRWDAPWSQIGQNQCPTGSDVGAYYYVYKLRVVFPDGSKHLLRLEPGSVQGADYSDDSGNGFYRFDYYGNGVGNCNGNAPRLSSPMVYYTTDGTFARVVVWNNGQSGTAAKISWRIYFTNGDYVLGGNDKDNNFQYRPVEICDRNGNCSSADYQFVPGTNTKYFTDLGDAYGRTITVTYGNTLNRDAAADTVTVPGFGGTTLQWTVNWTYVQAPNCPASPICQNGPGYMVASIAPPSQSALSPYYFCYSPFNPNSPPTNEPAACSATQGSGYGELSKIVLPSGATVSYDYWLDDNAPSGPCPNVSTQVPDIFANYPCRKTVSWDGSGSADEVSHLVSHRNSSNGTYADSVFTGPDGGVTTTTFGAYDYSGGYPGDWQSGLVTQISQPDGTQIAKTWAQNPSNPGTPSNSANFAWPYEGNNAYVSSETLAVGSNTATTTSSVDLNGNVYSRTDHPNWNTGSARTTTTNYWNAAVDNVFWSQSASAILSFPTLKTISDANSTAGDEYCYDATGNVLIHARLVSGTNGGFNCTAPVTVPSNYAATKYTYWTNTVASTNGQVAVAMDARGVSTKFTYDSNGLYVTEKDEACNQSLNANDACSGLAEVRKTQYVIDFNTGRVEEQYDKDNQTAACTYYKSGQTTAHCTESPSNSDWLARPVKIVDASGVATTFQYIDNGPAPYQKTSAPPNVVSAVCLNSMGRVAMTQTSETGSLNSPCSEASGVISVVRNYQFVSSGASAGRYEWVSNPHRSSGAGESTMGWTRRRFDGAGRLVEEATFSGATRPEYNSTQNLTGSATLTYTFTSNGACRTVKDQVENATAGTGSVTTICVDAAGRTSGVTETASDGSYGTSYSYDGLDNLLGVIQGDPQGQHQNRSFRYDGLSRLIWAKYPESATTSNCSLNSTNGSECFTYDNNGNMISRRDARDVVTCFDALSSGACSPDATYTSNTGYDGLNRLKRKRYTDGTDPVTYAYDQDLSGGQTNYPKGQLTSVTAGSTTVQYKQFDAMGRVLAHSQTVNATPAFNFSYQYNTAGDLRQETYPSGRIVDTTYDTYTGRLTAVSGTMGSNTTPYAGSSTDPILYAPQGSISQMAMGNTLVESRAYNSLLQPTAINLGTSGIPDSVRGIALGFRSSGNNGSPVSQTISGTGLAPAQTVTQLYSYDRLNRVSSITEGSISPCTPGTNCRTFGYDQYGNGWASGWNLQPNTPNSQNDYDAATNRFVPGFQNAGYDAAGNQTQIGVYTFTYDAENRLKSAVAGPPVSQATMYLYDGEGKRVAKVVCPTGGSTCTKDTTGAQVTWYVSDAMGQLATEYASAAPPSECGTPTCYLTADQLGSTRMMTDSAGVPKMCHDYLPFGEEILTGTDGRSGCYQAADGAGMKFTGKLRGSAYEASLDYFGARYFSGAMGRFTTLDPENRSGIVPDPQSWNAYAYARSLSE